MAKQTLILQVTPGISQASVQDLTRLRNDALSAEKQAATHAGHANLATEQAQAYALATSQAAGTATAAAKVTTDKASEAADAATTATEAKDTAINAASTATHQAEAAGQAAATATAKAEEAAAFAYAAALDPAPGKVPLADENGKISVEWLGKDIADKLRQDDIKLNDIGEPGKLGFGVGIAPSYMEGYSPLPSTHIKGHPEYGNYRYADGSVMVWIPAFYYRIGHPDNPTHSRMVDIEGYDWSHQSIHILPLNAFTSLADASQQGYAIHQAFIDGDIVRPGFMFDKYMCSNNAGVASSIANADPIRCRAAVADMPDQLSKLNGAPPDKLLGIFYAAKTREGDFEPSTRLMRAALNLLTMAHSQIFYPVDGVNQYIHTPLANHWFSGSPVTLQWGNQGYFKEVEYPYPYGIKVLYDLAIGDDGTAKTGSGVPFSLTTHNGQHCGVADLANNLRAFETGLHCEAITIKPTDYTWEEPWLDGTRRIIGLVIPNHGFVDDDLMKLDFVDIDEEPAPIYRIKVIDTNTLALPYDYLYVHETEWDDFLARSNFIITGKFNIVKDMVNYGYLIRDNPNDFQHHIDTIRRDLQPILMPWDDELDWVLTGPLYFSKTTNRSLFSSAAQGNDWSLTGLGVPQRGMLSYHGDHQPYGGSQYHQGLRGDIALLSCIAGSEDNNETQLWTIDFTHSMNDALDDVGFRLASYPLSNHEGVIRNVDEEWGQ